jgi:hypothetical protein
MLEDRIEAKWIDAFAKVFALCRVREDEAVAILSESQSRPLNVQLTELALARLGARPFHVRVPSPRQTAPVPVRSTGASRALQGQAPALEALAASGLVVDLTVEGMLHAKELQAILARGALERPVTLRIERDYVTAVDGQGTDAELMRRYFAAWDDPEVYATSHVGWGLNQRARYEALAIRSARDERHGAARLAGSFLYSTGANEFAGRHSEGHFDLPLRGCTVTLDSKPVVEGGELVPELR